jgi:hypothetical protein
MDYRGADGHVICVRYRGALATNGTDQRFWFRRGDKQQPYGLWRLRPEPVIVVEGETDSIALWTHGFNAIGVPGANAWRDDRFASLLDQCPTIYVHLEPDSGGATFRAAFEHSRLRDRVRFFTVAPAAKDPCELRARDPDGFRAAIEQALAGAQPAPAATMSLSHKSHVSQSHAEPTPLVHAIPPPELYPLDALGPILAPAARAIAELVQVPAALAANTILATAALAAQTQANVQSLGGPRPLSLYVLTIASSGDRKTAADNVALAPIHEHVRRMSLGYRTQLAEYERAAAVRKLDRARARKHAASGDEYAAALREIADEPPPRKPWLSCSEPTAEGLMRSLAEGQYAQGIYTDEGGQFLGGHALSEEAQLRSIALFSRLWQGACVDRVRATDHEHLVLYGRRLSMHLLVQPEVAMRLLGRPLYRSQGFLARWLMAAPDSLAGSRLHNPTHGEPHQDSRLRKYYHAIAQLLERPAVEDHEVGGLDPPCLALSPEARSLLVAAYDEIERAQGRDGELEPVRDWAAKAAEQACRIAGVITLAADADAISIPPELMESALRLVQHYMGEYERLVGSAGVPETIHHAQLLLEWIRRTHRAQVTARDVMRLGPGRAIRSADAARAALRTLAAHYWAHSDDGRTYTVDPAAFAEDSR